MLVVGVLALTACGGEPAAPACGPANCSGCCKGGACQVGTAGSGCGFGGEACAVCVTNEICTPAQSCAVDPSGLWRVRPASGAIASSNNGTAWDGDGSAPDVVIGLRCPGSTSDAISVESESYAPSWPAFVGCIATAAQMFATDTLFVLIDSDAFANDTITPAWAYRITEANLLAGRVGFLDYGGMISMEVELLKQ